MDPDSWTAVIRFYGGKCAFCRERCWSQQDHCVPLSRGGEHHISNVVPSCAPCNYRKGTKAYFPERMHPWMVRQ